VLNRPLILPTSEFNKNKKILDRECPEDYWVFLIYEESDKVRGNLEKGWDCGQYKILWIVVS
jgi:hypothetical protein